MALLALHAGVTCEAGTTKLCPIRCALIRIAITSGGRAAGLGQVEVGFARWSNGPMARVACSQVAAFGGIVAFSPVPPAALVP